MVAYLYLTVAGGVECSLKDELVFCTGKVAVPVGAFEKKIDLTFLRGDF